jgi:hypothetical protein
MKKINFFKSKKEKQTFFKSKKAIEINQQLVIYILAIIFIIVLLIFAVKSCGLIDEKQRNIILNDLKNGIRSLVELLSSKHGAIKHDIFEVPEDINLVCFVDLSHSDIIMNSTDLTRDYPMINDSLNSNTKENVFLINEKEVVHSFYGGDICFDYFPFYLCVIVHDNLLDVWFEGRSGCTNLYINWSIFPKQKRNLTKYINNPFFLIQEKDIGIDIENWRETLSLVPLTLFREDEITYVYNYSVAYKKDNVELNQTNIETLMIDEYNTNKTYLFNSSLYSTLYVGEKDSRGYEIQPVLIKSQEYFEFWIDPSAVILVDYNNKQSALIASLLAAYVNTPLIFINEGDLDYYKEHIFGKRVFIVTHSDISLDDTTYDYVKNYALSYDEISDTLLGIEGSVPAFAKLHSNITIN